MIKAIYKETGQECWLNMDFVVDAFPCEDGIIAYTFDNERGGYVISKKDFEVWRTNYVCLDTDVLRQEKQFVL